MFYREEALTCMRPEPSWQGPSHIKVLVEMECSFMQSLALITRWPQTGYACLIEGPGYTLFLLCKTSMSLTISMIRVLHLAR